MKKHTVLVALIATLYIVFCVSCATKPTFTEDYIDVHLLDPELFVNYKCGDVNPIIAKNSLFSKTKDYFVVFEIDAGFLEDTKFTVTDAVIYENEVPVKTKLFGSEELQDYWELFGIYKDNARMANTIKNKVFSLKGNSTNSKNEISRLFVIKTDESHKNFTSWKIFCTANSKDYSFVGETGFVAEEDTSASDEAAPKTTGTKLTVPKELLSDRAEELVTEEMKTETPAN